jgi:hypothetical protein
MASGGMTERIEEAAQMAALGLDPFKYLESRDSMERAMLVQLSNRTLEMRNILDNNLAVAIANNVGKLFK